MIETSGIASPEILGELINLLVLKKIDVFKKVHFTNTQGIAMGAKVAPARPMQSICYP